MSADPRVKVDFSKMHKLMQRFGREFMAEVGAVTVIKAKEMLKRGVSPVEGVGRLQAYKNAEKYPGLNSSKRGESATTEEGQALATKKQSPVNLRLTGKMLSALTFRALAEKVLIGFFDPEQAKKAQAHQHGTGNLPQRPILPTEPGQQFAQSIMLNVKRMIREKLEQFTKVNK
jgi:hypothetical protein